MIGVEVEINGERVCTVSTADISFLMSVLTWQAAFPLEYRVSGMVDGSDGASEHVTWAVRQLKLGDRVSLRIIEAEKSDEPLERSPGAPSQQA